MTYAGSSGPGATSGADGRSGAASRSSPGVSAVVPSPRGNSGSRVTTTRRPASDAVQARRSAG